jgi:hypothetical protein
VTSGSGVRQQGDTVTYATNNYWQSDVMWTFISTFALTLSLSLQYN